MNNCQPLTDKDCATKYRARRSKFDPVTRACAYPVPPLNGPLVFKSLAEPKPPRTYSPEELRAILKTVKLPQFLRTMEKLYEDYEWEMVRWEGGPVRLPPGRAAAAEDTGVAAVAAADESGVTYIDESPMPGARGLNVTCISATCVLWTVALLRDVLQKLFAMGPWHGQRQCGFFASAVSCCHWLRGACAKDRNEARPQQRSATSNTTVTPTTVQASAPRSTTQSGQSGQHANPALQERKGQGATLTADTPLESTRKSPHGGPREPATSAPFQLRDTTAIPQHKREDGGKKRHLPRTHNSRDAEQEHRQSVPAGATRPGSSWGDARPDVSAAHPPAYDVFGFPEAQHVPFGSGPGFAAPGDMPFFEGDYTSQRVWFSDEGVGLGYVPAAFARPHSASSHRCHSGLSSPYPASSPPSPGWYPFENVHHPAPSPCYAPYDAPLPGFSLDPSSTPYYGSTHAAPPSPFAGFDAFPPVSSVRQSSRVEVFSSDTDGAHGDNSAAAAPSPAGRTRRPNSMV